MSSLLRVATSLLLLGTSLACGGEKALAPSGRMVVTLVSGDTQSGEVGKELPVPLVVKVTDSRGTPWPGRLVTFSVVSGGGRMYVGSVESRSDGLARDYWTLGTQWGLEQKVEVRAIDEETGVKELFGTFTATLKAGPPAIVSGYRGYYQSTFAGDPLPDSIGVQVVDADYHPVTGATVTFAVAAGGGSVSPATATTNAQGRA